MPDSLLGHDGRLYADDWLSLADDAPLPAAGKWLVSLERWRAEGPLLRERATAIGVRLPNTEDVEALEDPTIWPLIALEFPKFTDGRAYSQARLLRERRGFRGELRACGEVLRDQLFYMRRCGFDRFQIADRYRPEELAAALQDFSQAYQPTGASAA